MGLSAAAGMDMATMAARALGQSQAHPSEDSVEWPTLKDGRRSESASREALAGIDDVHLRMKCSKAKRCNYCSHMVHRKREVIWSTGACLIGC
jgi:hypothetical protein